MKQLCAACPDCQKSDKEEPFPAPLCPLPIIYVPFQQIGMNMVGPLPKAATGNLFILMIVDYATMWPEAFPLRLMDSKSVENQLFIDVYQSWCTRTDIDRLW